MAICFKILIRVIVLCLVAPPVYQNTNGEDKDFINFIRNVNAFINVSQNVISKLNDEIKRSSMTLDRIATDSDKINRLSGEEEKEIKELENEMGNSVVLCPENAELREDDLVWHDRVVTNEPLHTKMIEYDRSLSPQEIESTLVLDNEDKIQITSQNYFRDKSSKLQNLINSLFKSRLGNFPIQSKSSPPSVKIIGDGNETLCIVVQPIFCPDTTEPAKSTSKRRVTFLNYDPYMDPPMKATKSLSTTETLAHTRTTSSTVGMTEMKGYSETQNENDIVFETTSKLSFTETSINDTYELNDFSGYTEKISFNAKDMKTNCTREPNRQGPMTAPTTFFNNTSTAFIKASSKFVNPLYINIDPGTASNLMGSPVTQIPSIGIPSSTFRMYPKLGLWKSLFGKNVNISLLDSSTSKTFVNYDNLANTSRLNQNGDFDSTKKNYTVLVLMYNIGKSRENGKLSYNIESINSLRNSNNTLVSLLQTTYPLNLGFNKFNGSDFNVNDTFVTECLAKVLTSESILTEEAHIPTNITTYEGVNTYMSTAVPFSTDPSIEIDNKIYSNYMHDHSIKNRPTNEPDLMKLIDEIKNKIQYKPDNYNNWDELLKPGLVRDGSSFIQTNNINLAKHKAISSQLDIQNLQDLTEVQEMDSTANIYIFSNENQTTTPEDHSNGAPTARTTTRKTGNSLRKILFLGIPQRNKNKSRNTDLYNFESKKEEKKTVERPIKVYVVDLKMVHPR